MNAHEIEFAPGKPSHGHFVGICPSVWGPEASASAVFREQPCRFEVSDDDVLVLDIGTEIRLMCRLGDAREALDQAVELGGC